MRITTTQVHLSHGLSTVSHAVPNRTTRPIEAYILAAIDRGRVRLSARKDDIGIHCWVAADSVSEEGATLLPAKLITDFVGNLPSSPVSLEAPSSADPTSCNVRCLRISADMKNALEDVREFPHIPSFTEGGELILQLDAELLKEIIAQVAFAAADKDDYSRSALLGMHIEMSGGEAVFAAADSFRLAIRTIPIPDDQLRCRMLLSARTMEELAKILPYDGTVQVLLTPDRNQALFHTDTMDLSARLLDAVFPNFRGVIPEAWTTRAILRTQELASTVRLMLPFAREGKNTIRFKITGTSNEYVGFDREPNTVKLEAVAQDVGNNENIVAAKVEGPDQEIHFNLKYLSDVLSVIGTPEVAFEVTARERPAVIKPVGQTNYVYVLMPMSNNQTSTARTSTEQDHAARVQVVAGR